MSEYKRWVSYIYAYDQGVKNNNVGYARIEVRGSQGKIVIHINVPELAESLKVYCYKDDEFRLLGEIHYNIGGYNSTFSVESAKLSDVSGLLIYYNRNKYYASAWDDRQMGDVGVLDPSPEPEPTPEITAMVSPPPVDTRDELIRVCEEMKEKCPQMYPFDDDEMKWCVKIDPKDINRLPTTSWQINNNSFLLHGYYSYRHLMLMKTDDEKPCYMIGVPGIYHNKDEFMAKMFGFDVFKAMNGSENVLGEFGYWCISILDKH